MAQIAAHDEFAQLVAKLTIAHEEHRAPLFTTGEAAIAPAKVHVRERPAEDTEALARMHKQGMPAQVHRERLGLELVEKLAREQCKELDIFRLHALSLLVVGILRVALQAQGQVPRNAPVPKIPPQKPELSSLIAA